mgnify:CR=1 FL=1
MDVTRCGGITEMLKVIALSQAWNLAFAPHAMEHIHMHLVSAAANGAFLERLLLFEDITAMVLRRSGTGRGDLTIPDKRD